MLLNISRFLYSQETPPWYDLHTHTHTLILREWVLVWWTDTVAYFYNVLTIYLFSSFFKRSFNKEYNPLSQQSIKMKMVKLIIEYKFEWGNTNFMQRAERVWSFNQRLPINLKIVFPLTHHLKSLSHNPVDQWAVGYTHVTEEKTEVQREETTKELYWRQKETRLRASPTSERTLPGSPCLSKSPILPALPSDGNHVPCFQRQDPSLPLGCFPVTPRT